VLGGLNEAYMADESVVSHQHCLMMIMNGIKHGLTDCEFLMAIVSLMHAKSIEFVFGDIFVQKCVPYFIKSVRANLSGRNASDNEHRMQHLCASVTILALIAHKALGSRYAVEMINGGL
jgi:hypothetical protein